MRLFVPALLCLFCVACAADTQVSGDRRTVGGSSVVFSVSPAKVETGRSVRFTVRITNNTGRPVKLEFSSGQQYDFWVTEGRTEVWRWSDGRAFTQALAERSIGPQETISYVESWTTEGAGSYVAHSVVLARDYDRPLTGKLTVGG